MIELSPICFGTGLEGNDQCPRCDRRAACINDEAGWGMGTFLQSYEAFNALYEKLTTGFSAEEEEALSDLLEMGGYTTSTEVDWIEVKGTLPAVATLEGEKNMAKKMAVEFEVKKKEFPNSYRVYCQLLGAIEPKAASN